MSRIAYLDCFSGVSGDMLLGVLIDAGVNPGHLEGELRALNLDGWSLHTERVSRAGLTATLAHVALAEAPQPHRRLPDILAIVEGSGLPVADRDQASSVFRSLAEAEASVHGTVPEAIDFHEVGAVDAIVDVCGAIVGLRLLGVERLYCSPLPAGGGTTRSQHGTLPVPAPATLAVITATGAPIAASGGDRPMEMVTPTGAAIVTTLADFERPAMHVDRVGYGAGGRDPEGWPNVLRLWLGEALEQPRAMILIETNIDDMNPEILGHVQEMLFAAGAADVWLQAVQMKKSRPGVVVSVICAPELEDALAKILLRETSTLGVRVREVRRHEAAREIVTFASSLGSAAVKVKRVPGEPPRVAPEFEVCRMLAHQHDLPLIEVYRIVEREALNHLAQAGDGA